MTEANYKAALELIAQLAPDSRFFWEDREGRQRDLMTAADLARAVLGDQVDLAKVSKERRGALR